MKAKILTTGVDDALIQSRAAILKKQYDVEVIRPEGVLAELQGQPYKLLLVCHSIPHDKATRLILAVRARFPHLCIVRLLAVYSPVIENPVSDRLVMVQHDPREWMKAIEQLLTPRPHAITSSYVSRGEHERTQQ